MNIHELPASAEMDAAVTEALGNCAHVLKYTSIGHGSGCFKCEKCDEAFAGLIYKAGLLVRPYSTDIATAWELVKHLLQSNPLQDIHLEHLKHTGWCVSTCYNKAEGGWDDWVDAETAPLAICHAFLKANGG